MRKVGVHALVARRWLACVWERIVMISLCEGVWCVYGRCCRGQLTIVCILGKPAAFKTDVG